MDDFLFISDLSLAARPQFPRRWSFDWLCHPRKYETILRQYSLGRAEKKKPERKHELFKKHVGSDTFINIKLRLMSSESSHKKKVRITQRKPIKRRSAYTTWKMYFFHGKLPVGVSYTRNLVVRRSIRGECTRIITIRQFLVIFLCFFLRTVTRGKLMQLDGKWDCLVPKRT